LIPGWNFPFIKAFHPRRDLIKTAWRKTMPIDTHSYLISRGWKGKGTALREGGLERPLVQAQKNNLKGLGKDRDDGFQFWDQ
jgi:hypothetical protein